MGSRSTSALGSWYGDQADLSVHKRQSFIKTTYSKTLTLFAFHTDKKQHLDILHIQKKKRNAQTDA